MGLYDFATLPPTPVWVTPVTPVVNAGHTVRQSSGVVLNDGRVLHVWYEGKESTPRSGYLLLGYAPNVKTYLTTSSSVTVDRTLVANLDGSSSTGAMAYPTWGNVCRGPDGALWLSHACFAGTDTGDWGASVTYHATMAAPPDPYVTRSMMWRSVDEGATWQYVTAFPQTVSLVAKNFNETSRVCLGGIEEVPAGFPNAGRWLATAAAASNYLGQRVWHGAVYLSDDSGVSWTRTLLATNGARAVYMSAGSYGFGSDGYIYLRSASNNGIVGTPNWWWRSDDGGSTWTQYQTVYSTTSTPDENTGAGPWLTVSTPNRLAGIAGTPPTTTIPVRVRENDLSTHALPHWDEAATLVPPDTFTEFYDTGPTFGAPGLLLRHLDEANAGLWQAHRLLGLPLTVGCVRPAKLHIPHKTWFLSTSPSVADRKLRDNWRAVVVWADTAQAASDLHLAHPIPVPLHTGNSPLAGTPVSHSSTIPTLHNYRALETWADTICWMARNDRFRLHIPHKDLSSRGVGRTAELENWLAIERWADRLHKA